MGFFHCFYGYQFLRLTHIFSSTALMFFYYLTYGARFGTLDLTYDFILLLVFSAISIIFVVFDDHGNLLILQWTATLVAT
jgi:hypothetical protein